QGQITDPDSPRVRLLDQAAQLFRQKGYERTTVRDIAGAVGIQSGSIFHHFSSKEDILRSVMSEALIYFTEILRDAISKAHGPRDKLLACIRSELQFTIGPDTTAIMSVLISEWRSLSAEVQQDILQYRDVYEQFWLDALQDAGKAGLLAGDVFVTRRLIAGAIHWTPYWFQLDGELSLEDLATETLQMIC
ncbi:MAG: TetR/AcrR family transcriptional regulator, partial [Fuerstiella sp.]|nr:TetR/AcrR family transcriptional regulator [Fuerstiella sp.]